MDVIGNVFCCLVITVGPADESTHLKYNGRKTSVGRVPGQSYSPLQVQLKMLNLALLKCNCYMDNVSGVTWVN